jgi:hypothetical protein
VPDPIRQGAASLDLSERVFRTATVAASPAAAAETTIATLNIAQDLAIMEGVLLVAHFAWTVGTAGVSGAVRIRRDSITGTVVKASGAKTRTAAQLVDDAIVGFDTGASLPNEVYVLTLTVASASAESTVSAVDFVALVI